MTMPFIFFFFASSTFRASKAHEASGKLCVHNMNTTYSEERESETLV